MLVVLLLVVTEGDSDTVEARDPDSPETASEAGSEVDVLLEIVLIDGDSVLPEVDGTTVGSREHEELLEDINSPCLGISFYVCRLNKQRLWTQLHLHIIFKEHSAILLCLLLTSTTVAPSFQICS